MNNKVVDRYEQAQSLLHGYLSSKLVLNDAIFPHWIIGSNCFWYERETRGKPGKQFRLVDATDGNNVEAFDFQELARALESVAVDEVVDPMSLVIQVVDISLYPRKIYFNAFDQRWIFDSEKNLCQAVEVSVERGLKSPDGRSICFVQNHNLWVKNIITGEKKALTKDGVEDNPYGTASPIGAPISPEIQAVWSPDSACIFTHQLDQREVASRLIVHHSPRNDNARPYWSEYKAAYPGDKNIECYRLLSINVGTGLQQAADYNNIPICRFGAGFFSDENFGWWANDSRRAYFVEIIRGAASVRLVEFDTHTGTTHVVFEETSSTYVKLSHDLLQPPIIVPLSDTNEVIWFSERSGWAHLYLYDLNVGELKVTITSGEWLVREILHVDVERRNLIIQTSARNTNISPYYRDICRVNIDTGELVILAAGNYDYSVFTPNSMQTKIRTMMDFDVSGVMGVCPSGDYIVTTYSRVDTVPVSVLINRFGEEILEIETADIVGLSTAWQWPEPIKVLAADGHTDLYGVIYRPPGFSPDVSYPVLDFSCGHVGFSYVPHASFINGAFGGYSYLSGAAFAALGFIVVAIEGRGSLYRP